MSMHSATMNVDTCITKTGGKVYCRHLLRESYRDEAGKSQHRTVANISRCSPKEIAAIRLALRYKDDLVKMIQANRRFRTRQGGSVGAVWTVYEVARRLGLEKALGPSREGRLAMWQVLARVIDQGSRLSAVRLAGSQCACEVLGLGAFNEDDLYANLDWLAERQPTIEKRLWRERKPRLDEAGLFLYDVTSTYLEGTENELAAFGYNRDGKRGKKQIVIGLLTTGEGEPVSVEAFEGNTSDPQTFTPQIEKVLDRFAVKDVTFVGDRGMIKSAQIEALGHEGFHYITAITKPQIEALLREGTFQMELFDQPLVEVTTDKGVRYVLRRNPTRAEEIATSRREKLAALVKTLDARNTYLAQHRRAKVEVALRGVREHTERLRIERWASVSSDPGARRLVLEVNGEARAEEAKLDGCYVIKTDLPADKADKEIILDRYRDLALVEMGFRTCKTAELEMRPVYVRLASRTRGHVFVVLLAYRIARELARCWRRLDTTVQEGLNQLAQLCANELVEKDQTLCCQVPEPRAPLRELLDAAHVRLPDALPAKGVTVSTKRKLPERRKKT